MRRNSYAYRLDVTYPAGSLDETGCPDPDWTPPGWRDGSTCFAEHGQLANDPNHECQYCTAPFTWPMVRTYLSANGAATRAALFASYGATATVTRSQPIRWDAS